MSSEQIVRQILRYADQNETNSQLLSLLKSGVIQLDDVVYCSYCNQYDEYTCSGWFVCLYKNIMKGCMENCHKRCCFTWTLNSERTGLYCEMCVRNGCLEKSTSEDDDPPPYSIE